MVLEDAHLYRGHLASKVLEKNKSPDITKNHAELQCQELRFFRTLCLDSAVLAYV